MPAHDRAIVAVAVIFLIHFAIGQTHGESPHPSAPQLSFTGLSDERISLDQFRGNVVLLNFWTTSCSVCVAEARTLAALQDHYGSRGLRIVAVALDGDAELVRKFYEQHHLDYTVALGDPGLLEQLGAAGFPVTLIIGRDGRVYSQHSGVATQQALEIEIDQLLAADAKTEVAGFRLADGAEIPHFPTPQELESEVPAIDVSHLTKAQLSELKRRLDSGSCPCECNRSVLKCRLTHSNCKQSQRLARETIENLYSPIAKERE